MQWAAIILPDLALDAIRRMGADAQAPIALTQGPPQRRIVHSCTFTASAAGVRPGQALAAARALLPELVAMHDDPARTDALRELLIAWAYAYSGEVALLAPDALVLEVGASMNLFGPWPVFERCLRAELGALGITHRIAVAAQPRAAMVLASHRDGLAVAGAAAMLQSLREVPLEAARLPEVAAEFLRSLGLQRLGQVFDLPRAGLARRCGETLVDNLDRLQGHAPDPLVRYRAPDRFEGKVDFDAGIRSSETLLFPLRRLVHDLAVFLAARDGGVEQIELKFEHDECQPTSIHLRTPSPERDPAQWNSIVRLRLEHLSLPAPVIGVRLIAHELPPFVPVAGALFDGTGSATLTWPQLVARLQARLGEGSVETWFPAADHRPEHAWGRVPQAQMLPDCAARPLWLLPRPIPLRDRALQVLSGPERIESGWWDGREARRDYYVLRTSLGQRAWAFRPAGVSDGEWLLHGWFA
jgi:protein ImuB